MTYDQAVKEFKYSHLNLYINKADYWTAQQAWAMFIDDLCKSERITQKQFDKWETPFPYGKPLKPSSRQLCRAYDI